MDPAHRRIGVDGDDVHHTSAATPHDPSQKSSGTNQLGGVEAGKYELMDHDQLKRKSTGRNAMPRRTEHLANETGPHIVWRREGRVWSAHLLMDIDMCGEGPAKCVLLGRCAQKEADLPKVVRMSRD
jgi:hypothetical protein